MWRKLDDNRTTRLKCLLSVAEDHDPCIVRDCDISNPWVLEQAMGVDVGLEWRFSTPNTPFSFRGVFYYVSQHPENRLPFLFAVTPILILHISRSTLRRIVFAIWSHSCRLASSPSQLCHLMSQS